MLQQPNESKPYPREVYYYVLSNIEGLGLASARRLLEIAGDIETLFEEAEKFNEFSASARRKLIETRSNKPLWDEASATLAHAKEKGITLVTFDNDTLYPQLLKQCIDAPLLLFAQGQVGYLSSPHNISIVGTRNASSYGRFAVAKTIEAIALKVPDAVIVSGLAFGIDVAAHEAAMEQNLGTIAVMAYGHNFIYPTEHRKIAQRIIEKGVMLSEYPPKTSIERHRFVARNRIVAGISSATVVIESAQKGGALLTANMALGYNRDVFALPGRITDRYSAGCNNLIEQNKAQLFTNSETLLESLGWNNINTSTSVAGSQPSLLTNQQIPNDPILQIIAKHEAILINDLLPLCNLTYSQLTAKLFDLELDGYIETLPGGKITLAFR